jgi:hypothetical protein
MKRTAVFLGFLLLFPGPGHAAAEGDLSLAECFRMALSRSEEVAVRKEAVIATRADFLKA